MSANADVAAILGLRNGNVAGRLGLRNGNVAAILGLRNVNVAAILGRAPQRPQGSIGPTLLAQRPLRTLPRPLHF